MGPLDLDLDEQLQLAGAAPKEHPRNIGAYLDPLLQVVPSPSPAVPLEALLADLRRYYERLAESLLEFLHGLAYWDNLNETKRARVVQHLRGGIPKLAAQHYDEGLRRLCLDCPEMFIWTLLRENTASRNELESRLEGLITEATGQIGNSLNGMSALLRGLILPVQGIHIPEELIQSNEAQLSRPVADSQSEPDSSESQFSLPTLERAYINPGGRVGDASAGPRLADDSWWETQPETDDLQWFLAGYLTTAAAPSAAGR